VHVVPVGFEEDRAVSGLMELGATDIYLLIDEKQGPWGENARRHAGRVEERLSQVFLDPSHLQKVDYDPTKYESCRKVILRILTKEKDAKKIYLNVSSSTKLCSIAFALAATEHENAFLYYIVPKKYNLPMQGLPFSSGMERIEVFSPRSYEFGELEDVILRTLASGTYSSLGDLNAAILPEEISKASRAKLSYYVRKLQKQGYIDFDPGKHIALTTLGKTRLTPPVDDAPLPPVHYPRDSNAGNEQSVTPLSESSSEGGR